jgi:hypothetical protein
LAAAQALAYGLREISTSSRHRSVFASFRQLRRSGDGEIEFAVFTRR